MIPSLQYQPPRHKISSLPKYTSPTTKPLDLEPRTVGIMAGFILISQHCHTGKENEMLLVNFPAFTRLLNPSK